MSPGYSGTPLAKKLGVKDGQKTWRVDMPASVATAIEEYGIRPNVLHVLEPGIEMAHLFVIRRADLTNLVTQLDPLLAADGTIWVSWPKKSSGVASDVTEDVVRAEALPLGLVDVKVCAIDEIWSGLKLVIRKERRTERNLR